MTRRSAKGSRLHSARIRRGPSGGDAATNGPSGAAALSAAARPRGAALYLRLVDERLGIVGSGAIACGLAAVAAQRGPVVVRRAVRGVGRARARVDRRAPGSSARTPTAGALTVMTELAELAGASVLVEAVAEDHASRPACCGPPTPRAAARRPGDDDLLAVDRRARAACGAATTRFVGLHVFNPVPKMELVELAFPDAASERDRGADRELCAALGKKAVEVPDIARLRRQPPAVPLPLRAVELMEQTGLSGERGRSLHDARRRPPDGPARAAGLRRPRRRRGDRRGDRAARAGALTLLVEQGALGRKSGNGFHSYETTAQATQAPAGVSR